MLLEDLLFEDVPRSFKVRVLVLENIGELFSALTIL